MILPETAGEQLLVADDAVVGVRTGDKGRGREGEELPRFEPGSDLRAQVTILAEGTQGHLSLAAFERFGLAGSSPQTWALGVKEVWRVPRPLREVIHTMGWPLRPAARYREFGGSFVYPMGEDMVDDRDGGRARLPRRGALGARPAAGAEDPSADPADPRGRRAGRVGREDDPGGRVRRAAAALHAPGLLVVGDAAGLVNVPALKGIHYAVESGRLAAEAAWRSLRRRAISARYDTALRSSFVWRDLRGVRNMRQAFGAGFWRGSALARALRR